MTFRHLLAAAALALAAGPCRAAGDTASWHPDASARCLSPPYEEAATPVQASVAALVAKARDALAGFPSLLAALGSSGPEICLEDREIEARGYLDVERDILVLREALPAAEAMMILVHELRHVDQLRHGFCPGNDLSMQETARATFAVEADAQAITVLVAWSLREAGDGVPWSTLLDQPHYADIARRFEAAINGGADISTAVADAFDQWYASDWRIDVYYVASCSDYLDRQDRTDALPSYNTLGADFLETLCRLPDGHPYPCAFPDFPVR